jgi:hypothetical protein
MCIRHHTHWSRVSHWSGRQLVVTIINIISRDPYLVSFPLTGEFHNWQNKVRVDGKRKRIHRSGTWHEKSPTVDFLAFRDCPRPHPFPQELPQERVPCESERTPLPARHVPPPPQITNPQHRVTVVYYEGIKRYLKRRPIHECRSDERLKTKVKLTKDYKLQLRDR